MENHPVFPDLSGKVALVMGIGQAATANKSLWGNGAAIAYVLAQNNAVIFGCDISLEAAEYTKSRLPASCDVMVADVTSSIDVAKVVEACMAKHGRIDILVNNVGVPASGDAVSLPEDIWDRQMEVNLKSVYLSCHHVLPIMEKQGSGAVVNNASIAGMRYLGKPQVAYNSAKAAVIHFTRVTAVMIAAKGVRLNCVVPGLMLTPLVEQLGESDDPKKRDMFRKITCHNVPMGRMGDAFDVANATAFLASDAAKYITGQNLVVDGGLVVSTGT
ncbi:putative short chain type dehydrogenase [Dactylonectria estremocensis]|uniref:Short chain type dehydrogenase n=1 Tax=Dactylonectria estremocensis TaxID=1079267 RepID=A0A9P9DT30_9HYPO|nr:putative short chain type dehydrogenase [Dactylonectria estremocensis]